MEKILGGAHVFAENDIDTDLIIAANFLTTFDKKILAQHALENLRPNFFSQISAGDFLVAGKNFGCGSSREHAVWALQATGLAGVIAENFARIFLRNSKNNDFFTFSLEAAPKKFSQNDKIEIDFSAKKIKNLTQKTEFDFWF